MADPNAPVATAPTDTTPHDVGTATRPMDASSLRIMALEGEVTGLSSLLESATERETDLRAQCSDLANKLFASEAMRANVPNPHPMDLAMRAVAALEILALDRAYTASTQAVPRSVGPEAMAHRAALLDRASKLAKSVTD